MIIVPTILAFFVPQCISLAKKIYRRVFLKNDDEYSITIYKNAEYVLFDDVALYITHSLKSEMHHVISYSNNEYDNTPECEVNLLWNATYTVMFNEDKIFISFEEIVDENSRDRDRPVLINGNTNAVQTINPRIQPPYKIILRAKSRDILDKYIKFVCDEQEQLKLMLKNVYFLQNSKDLEWKQHNITIHKVLNNVFVPEAEKIKNCVEQFINGEEYYKQCGIPYKLSFLFYGIPGTGKSSMIYALARQYGCVIYFIKTREDLNHLRHIVQTIPKKVKHIIVFEEIDLLIGSVETLNVKKTGVGKYVVNDAALSVCLDVLDGYNYIYNSILVFTTNHVERLPANLKRPGRMDIHVEFTYVLPQQIEDMFKVFFSKNVRVSFTRPNVKITSSDVINVYILPNSKNIDQAIAELDELGVCVELK